jgi:hypothetical protein
VNLYSVYWKRCYDHRSQRPTVLKNFVASPEKTINIVGANVLAFVDRKQCKVYPTLKLHFFIAVFRLLFLPVQFNPSGYRRINANYCIWVCGG